MRGAFYCILASMNEITNLPPDYSFGHDFSYSSWPVDSVATFCNVPWSADYRDVWMPDSVAQVDAYIDSMEGSNLRFDKLTYLKFNEPLVLDVAFNRINKFNYVRVTNPLQPINGGDSAKAFYYFVVGVEYRAPNATQVTLQLDVWTTFLKQWSVGRCYLERGHMGIANDANFNQFGRAFLTNPEGMDTGGEYRIAEALALWGESAQTPEYDVLITFAVDATANPFESYSPTDDYYAPGVKSANGYGSQQIRGGTDTFVLKSNQLSQYMTAMKPYPWITAGIVGITAVPKLTNMFPNYTYPKPNSFPIDTPDGSVNYPPEDPQATGKSLLAYTPNSGFGDTISMTPKIDSVANFRDKLSAMIPAKYRPLKKFLTFPYSVIEVTNFNGSPMVLKPELIPSNNLELRTLTTLTPGNERMETYVTGYNRGTMPGSGTYFDDGGEYLDQAIVNADLPRLPVVNDNSALTIAQNQGTIAAQKQAAEWSQQKALAGNQNTYESTRLGLQNTRQNAQIQADAGVTANNLSNRAMVAQNMTQSLGGIVTGGAGGAIGGGAKGAAVGVAGAAMASTLQAIGTRQQVAANNDMAMLNYDTSTAIMGNNDATGRAINNANKDLADWAAKGDYAGTIGAIQAKVQQMDMVQPTVAGQFGGQVARLIYGGFSLAVRFKLIDDAAIRRLGDFWHRYGYAVNLFTTPPTNLHCMSKFTYWKMTETYLTSGAMPETFKQTIRGILEKGVTVWRNPADIGNTDISNNTPVGGITI